MLLHKKTPFKQINILTSLLSCMCNFCNYIDNFDADIACFSYSCVIVLVGVTCKPMNWLQSIDEFNRASNQLAILIRKYLHFDDIFVIGCTGSCQVTTFGTANDQNGVKMAAFPFQCIIWVQTPLNWRFIRWRVAKSLLTKFDIHKTHISVEILSLSRHHYYRKRFRIYYGL